MKFLPLASLALIASLALTSCAAGQSKNKYYEKGFKIASSDSFPELMSEFSSNEQEGYIVVLCELALRDYFVLTGDKDFAYPTKEEIKSFVKGCEAGFKDAWRP